MALSIRPCNKDIYYNTDILRTPKPVRLYNEGPDNSENKLRMSERLSNFSRKHKLRNKIALLKINPLVRRAHVCAEWNDVCAENRCVASSKRKRSYR